MSVRLGVGFGELKPLENPNLSVASIQVRDPDGYPFFWLNVVGSGVQSFWQAVENPQDDFIVYATGALDVRNFFGDIYTAAFLKRVRSICQDAGGCRGFVATGTGLYVVGEDDRWYDPDSGNALSDKAVEFETKLYHSIRESLEGSEFLAKVQEAWAKLLKEKDASSQSLEQFLEAYQGPGGNLDVQKFARDFLGLGLGTLGETPGKCVRFLWWCVGTSYAGAVGLTNPNVYESDNPETSPGVNRITWRYDFGNYQEPWYSPYSWSYYPSPAPTNPHARTATDPNARWGSPEFLGGRVKAWYEPTTNENQSHGLLGCCPTAFIRLLAWHYRNGLRFSIKVPGNSSWITPTGWEDLTGLVAWPMRIATVNSKKIYQPLISKVMFSGHFVNGVLTEPYRFIYGANTYLRNYTNLPSNYRVVGDSVRDSIAEAIADLISGGSLVLAPITWVKYTQDTWHIAHTARRAIGRFNEPIVALYALRSAPSPAELFTAHYGLSFAYKVTEFWDWADTWAWIRPWNYSRDWKPGRWHHLSEFWQLTGGAYALDH